MESYCPWPTCGPDCAPSKSSDRRTGRSSSGQGKQNAQMESASDPSVLDGGGQEKKMRMFDERCPREEHAAVPNHSCGASGCMQRAASLLLTVNVVCFFAAGSTFAAVTEVVVTGREPWAGGKEFELAKHSAFNLEALQDVRLSDAFLFEPRVYSCMDRGYCLSSARTPRDSGTRVCVRIFAERTLNCFAGTPHAGSRISITRLGE